MENLRGDKIMMMVSVSMVIMGWLSLVVMGDPTLHKVGGKMGWNQNVNYTHWSSQEHVYVDDWLIFVFDKQYYNVLEVNKTSYESCIESDFIKNVTRGGRDVVQLTEAKTYYYISGGGYCFHGMKVSVNVEEYQITALAPSPNVMISDSPLPISLYTCIWIILANIFYVTLVL